MSAALIVGAGLLGRALAAQHRRLALPFTATSRDSLDLDKPLPGWLHGSRFGVVYVCAGISGTACDADPVLSRRINVERTVALAEHLVGRGAFVVYPSTDRVFDGSVPRVPADAPHSPTTEYGRQKAAAERALLAIGNVAVVRLTKVVDPDFPLFRSVAAGRPAFRNRVFAPLPLSLVADLLCRIGQTREPGIYQLSGARELSYADAALRVLSPDRVRIADSPDPSEPAFASLDMSRVTARFGVAAPEFDAVLRELDVSVYA